MSVNPMREPHEAYPLDVYYPTPEDLKECGQYWDEVDYQAEYDDDDFDNDGGFDDDRQPSEYEEWQDFMGGDDWDHGQYDDNPVYGEDY